MERIKRSTAIKCPRMTRRSCSDVSTFALGFVALEEARHEEFLRQRRQPHAAGLAVADQSRRIVGIDDFEHRARHRRVVDDRVVVLGVERLVHGQAHQRVAVGRREEDVASSTSSRTQRWNCGVISVPPQKMPRDAGLLQRDLLGQRFEQLRRGEHAPDVVVRLEQRQRLIDDVALVGLPPDPSGAP